MNTRPNSEATTAALIWTALVVIVSKGWLLSARRWIGDRTHPPSAPDPNAFVSSSPGGSGPDFAAVPATYGSVVNAAKAAGFSGTGLNTIVAIAGAESGWNPRARGVNTDGSVDRGVFQINARWHPEVTDACAYDIGCSAQAAYRISAQGSRFSPWSTFNNGAYLKHMRDVSGAATAAAANAASAAGAALGAVFH